MALLGKWNWYLPSWLGWLPELRIEAPHPPAAPPAGLNRPAGTTDRTRPQRSDGSRPAAVRRATSD
jgi:hypothetical protein